MPEQIKHVPEGYVTAADACRIMGIQYRGAHVLMERLGDKGLIRPLIARTVEDKESHIFQRHSVEEFAKRQAAIKSKGYSYDEVVMLTGAATSIKSADLERVWAARNGIEVSREWLGTRLLPTRTFERAAVDRYVALANETKADFIRTDQVRKFIAHMEGWNQNDKRIAARRHLFGAWAKHNKIETRALYEPDSTSYRCYFKLDDVMRYLAAYRDLKSTHIRHDAVSHQIRLQRNTWLRTSLSVLRRFAEPMGVECRVVWDHRCVKASAVYLRASQVDDAIARWRK